MSDNLKNTVLVDHARINVNEARNLKYWCKELGVCAAQLKDAVDSAGVSTNAVRTYLNKYSINPERKTS